MIRLRSRALLALAAGLAIIGLSGCNPTIPEADTTESPSASVSQAPTPTPTPTAIVAAPQFDDVDPAQFAFVLVDQSLLDQLGVIPDGVHFLVPEAGLACSLWTGAFGDADGSTFTGERWGCFKDDDHWPTDMVPPDLAFCVQDAPCPVNGVRADGDGVPSGFVVGDVVFPAQWGLHPEAAAITTLGDGQQVRFGDVVCSRTALEVTCQNAASGHGFSASDVAVSWW